MCNSIGKILLVDDEINVLRSLNRLLITESIEVILATSGQEALAILEDETVDLVISDYKMPDMSGTQLLEKIKYLHPKIMRVILSGYVEMDIIHNALSTGIALGYLTKPWHDYDITEWIKQTLQTIQVLKNEELLNVFKQIDRLPGIPEIFHKVTAAINANRSIKEIAVLVNKDVSLSAKILQIANSPFFGIKGCKSMEQAIMIIGLNAIKDVILVNMLTAHKQLNTKQKLWIDQVIHESLCITHGMEKVNKLTKHDQNQYTFTNLGLLSNIGKIILLTYLPDVYQLIISKQQDGLTFYEAEIELGFQRRTHSEIGGFFLSLCHMPLTIIEPILYYRQSTELALQNNYFARILYLISSGMENIYKDISVKDGIYPDWSSDVISKDTLEQIFTHMEELYEHKY